MTTLKYMSTQMYLTSVGSKTICNSVVANFTRWLTKVVDDLYGDHEDIVLFVLDGGGESDELHISWGVWCSGINTPA